MCGQKILICVIIYIIKIKIILMRNKFGGILIMLKKCLFLLSILCLILFISNTVLASDVVMDLNTSNTNTNSSNQAVDNTIYGGGTSSGDEIIPSTEIDSPISDISVSNDYDVESSDELSISNMINIVLIVVGIVLILLGIAIILKLK